MPKSKIITLTEWFIRVKAVYLQDKADGIEISKLMAKLPFRKPKDA